MTDDYAWLVDALRLLVAIPIAIGIAIAVYLFWPKKRGGDDD